MKYTSYRRCCADVWGTKPSVWKTLHFLFLSPGALALWIISVTCNLTGTSILALSRDQFFKNNHPLYHKKETFPSMSPSGAFCLLPSAYGFLLINGDPALIIDHIILGELLYSVCYDSSIQYLFIKHLGNRSSLVDDSRNGRIDRHNVSDLQKPTIKQQRKTPNEEIKKII